MVNPDIDQTKKALREAMRRRVHAGLVPYAGQWVTRSVLEQEARRERGKARVGALELLLLYAGAAIVSLWLLGIVRYLSS